MLQLNPADRLVAEEERKKLGYGNRSLPTGVLAPQPQPTTSDGRQTGNVLTTTPVQTALPAGPLPTSGASPSKGGQSNGLINLSLGAKPLLPPEAQAPTYEAATTTAQQAQPYGFKPYDFTVTPNQTVQGQLQQIIQTNSPLMQQAQARARAEMNARGLLNSSMAIGAGQQAVIQQALPIAQQDAAAFERAATNTSQAYNVARQFKAAAQNQSSQLNAQLGTETRLANMQAINAQRAQEADIALRWQLATQETNLQLALNQRDNVTKELLARIQADTTLSVTEREMQSRELIAYQDNLNRELLARIQAETQLGVVDKQNASAELISSQESLTRLLLGQIQADTSLSIAEKQTKSAELIAERDNLTREALALIDADTSLTIADKQFASAELIAERDNATREMIAQIQADVSLSVADKQALTAKYVAERDALVKEQVAKIQANNAWSIAQRQAASAELIAQRDNATAEIIANLQATATLSKTQLETENLLEIARLDNEQKDKIAKLDADNRALIQANASAANMFTEVVKNIGGLQADKDLSGDAKQAAIQAQLDYLNEGLKAVSNIASTDSKNLESLNLGKYFSVATGPSQSDTAPTGTQGVPSATSGLLYYQFDDGSSFVSAPNTPTPAGKTLISATPYGG